MSSSPHDALFKRAFSDPEVAAPLLRWQLPPEIRSRVDWSTLTLEPGTYVDAALRARHTDLLFRAVLGGEEAFLYLLLEHQSTPDRFMALRMLSYLVRVWERWRRAHPKAAALPVVVPIVLFHGDRTWDAPIEVADLLDAPPEVQHALGASVPRLEFVLDDLSRATDAAIAARALDVFGELTLRALTRLRSSEHPVADLMAWLPLFRSMMAARSGLQRLAAILEYVRSTTDVGLGAVEAFVGHLGTTAEEIEMTLAERDQALGWQRGQARLVTKQLTLRFGPLPEVFAVRVHEAEPEALERWAERLLSAESLDEVFAGEPKSLD